MSAVATRALDAREHPLRAGEPLPAALARQYRLRAIFECGKLDPQVADTNVLAPFPLLIRQHTWLDLARRAEALFHEALAAEQELVRRPDLHRALGLPRSIRAAVASRAPVGSSAAPRIARLDFHWAADTPGGPPDWRVSEINADVPGGLIEAGALAALIRDLHRTIPGSALDAAMVPPDPAQVLADAIGARVRGHQQPLVALVHATAFADDFQVMRRLADCLEARGVGALLVAPDHLAWDAEGRPCHRQSGQPVAGLVRFFPAEWLPELTPTWIDALLRRRRAPWTGYFGSAPVGVIVNPGTALLVQSKRWPITWSQLETPVPTWRSSLPETRDPRDLNACHDAPDWVLKPALGRVGEGVLIPGQPTRDERAIRRAARRHPAHWIAQRPFYSVPVNSASGPLHICLGVYVIDARAAGLYARAALRPLIDQGAVELPVLLLPETPPPPAAQPRAMEAA